jgi:hypothetical protein
MPDATDGRRRNLLIFAVAVVAIAILASGGGLTGRATGGQGCAGGDPALLPAIDPTALTAEEGCDIEAILAHPDRLAVLQEQVFTPTCAGCHQPGALSAELDLSTAEASLASLIDVPAQNAVASENGWLRVLPGNPELSFVLRKIGGPGVGEGAPMPPGDHAVTETYRTLLSEWIADGAPASTGDSLDELAACQALDTRLGETMAFADPTTECAECHTQHVEEWSISSHAYAAKDPVFHAMVQLGQQATGGNLDQFCVQCHSPIGMATGQTEVVFDEARQTYTQDVLGLDDLAKTGVSCDVCHSVTAVLEPHNARMVMSPNGIRRGTIEDPVHTDAHASAYSDLHNSSDLCSSCHAVTNPKGALVEETFQEWTESPAAELGQTCQTCHMPSYTGQAAPGGPERELHSHFFVGVDVSLLPPEEFPGYDELREKTAELLRTSATMSVTMDMTTRELVVNVENLAGHALPSGATAERQLWLEVIVKDETGAVILESGTLDEAGNLRDAFESHSTAPGSDPDLTVYTQYMLSDTVLAEITDTTEQSARKAELTAACDDIYGGQMPEGVSVVPFPWQANWQCNHMIRPGETVEERYTVPDIGASSMTVDVRLLFRSFPPYFLTELEESADLDPDVATRMPLVNIAETHLELSAALEEIE